MTHPDVPAPPALAPIRHLCPRCGRNHGGLLLCSSCRGSHLVLRVNVPEGLSPTELGVLVDRAVRAYLGGHRYGL